jgi:uncharacterized protein (DUF427 family)
MVKAIWNDIVIAESTNCEIIENNYYFPPEDVKKQYLRKSDTRSTCPWKGKAHYYDVIVNNEENKDAAWYYPEPKSAAEKIKNYVAFWNGVVIKE